MGKSKTSRRTLPSSPLTETPALDPTPEELQEAEQLSEATPVLEHEPWENFTGNDQVPLFDLMQLIPASAWEDELMVYLYRLDPPVANKSGEKKYICRYTQPFDEDTIREQHGGGKYHAIMKRGTATLKNAKFSIEGPPKLQEGQTFRGSAVQASPQGTVLPPQNDIAAIVKQVIEATKGDSTAVSAGIEVMKRAMGDGLELQKTIMQQQIGSDTGSKVGDKILDALLPRLLTPAPENPMVGELMKAAISLLKDGRRENPAAQPTPSNDPMKQLDVVKELLGVDSLRELFELGAGGKQQPYWVTLLGNAIEKLPTLLTEYASMQEQAFRRAVMAHQLGAGQPTMGEGFPPTPPMGSVTPVTGAPAAPPPAPPPTMTAEVQSQMIAGVVDGICRAYDEGYPGDVAGAHIRLSFPQLVETLQPMLADPAQLAQFVAQIPPLAERSKESDWTEFQAEFVEELTKVPEPAGEPVVTAPQPNTNGQVA